MRASCLTLVGNRGGAGKGETLESESSGGRAECFAREGKGETLETSGYGLRALPARTREVEGSCLTFRGKGGERDDATELRALASLKGRCDRTGRGLRGAGSAVG